MTSGFEPEKTGSTPVCAYHKKTRELASVFVASNQMPHIPSKEAMINAVKKSGCSNLTALPLDAMSAEEIYSHLIAAKCPCLRKLMAKKDQP